MVANGSMQNSSPNNQGENVNSNCNPNINLKIRPQDIDLSLDLEKNLAYLKQIFCYPLNRDFSIREIHIKAINRRGVLLFLQGMTDISSVEKQVITPLVREIIAVEDRTDILTDLSSKVLTGKGVLDISFSIYFYSF